MDPPSVKEEEDFNEGGGQDPRTHHFNKTSPELYSIIKRIHQQTIPSSFHSLVSICLDRWPIMLHLLRIHTLLRKQSTHNNYLDVKSKDVQDTCCHEIFKGWGCTTEVGMDEFFYVSS